MPPQPVIVHKLIKSILSMLCTPFPFFPASLSFGLFTEGKQLI